MKRLFITLFIAILAVTTVIAAPNNKVKKIIKKEVAKYKAEKWQPISGAPTLEEQVAAYLELQEKTDPNGTPIYIIATNKGASMSPRMAETKAIQGCKTIAAEKILTELGIFKKEKNLNLGRAKRIIALQRKGKDGNTEVLISLAFNRAEVLKANKHLVEKN
jgi:hypothetical protein